MDIRERLLEIKRELTELIKKRTDERVLPIDLNDKVDSFIDWYFKNIIKGNYTNIGEKRLPIEIKNFIEKFAVWYELKVPDEEVGKLKLNSSQETKEIDDVIVSLGGSKYIGLSYNNIIYFNPDLDAHLHLTGDGFVISTIFLEQIKKKK